MKPKLLIAALLLLIASTARAQVDKSHWTVAQRRIVAYVPCGDQGLTNNPRGVSPWLLDHGLYSFTTLTTGKLEQFYQQGFRRFVLWECFGRMPAVQTWKFTRHGCPCSYDTVMSITDWPDLQATNFAPYKPMLTTFVPAIQGFKRLHPDVEIFCYVGTSMGNPILEAMLPADRPAFLQKCLQPYLAAGVDGLIFDSASGIPPDHWMVDCFDRLKRLGIKVFVEAAPANYPYQVKLGFFSSLEQLANVPGNTAFTVPSTANGANVGFLPLDMVQGERMGFEAAAKPASYPTTLAWLQDIIPAALNSGQIDSVCIASAWFVNDPSMQGMSVNDLEYLLSSKATTTTVKTTMRTAPRNLQLDPLKKWNLPTN